MASYPYVSVQKRGAGLIGINALARLSRYNALEDCGRVPKSEGEAQHGACRKGGRCHFILGA